MSTCTDIDACFQEISAYFSHEKTGFPLIVNTENAEQYNAIMNRLEVDASTEKIMVSDTCAPDGLPDVSKAQRMIGGDGRFILGGIAQALMLRGETDLIDKVGELLSYSICGYCVIVLYRCDTIIARHCGKDPRLERRTVLVQGESTPLPTIYIAKNKAAVWGHHIDGLKALFRWLEEIPLRDGKAYQAVTVVTGKSATLFSGALYTVREAGGVYDLLCKKYPDIKNATKNAYGTEERWYWLNDELKDCTNFSAYVTSKFGATSNLSLRCKSVFSSSDVLKQWLLWLALKVFGEPSNAYLTLVLCETETVDDFRSSIVLKLADIDVTATQFSRYYDERKQMLDAIGENPELLEQYITRIGKHEKNALYYLTDCSEIERHEIMRLLAAYEYSDTEIHNAMAKVSDALKLYLKRFDFDETNTKLPEGDAAFRTTLTDYFEAYKHQKVTNRLDGEFLKQVNEFACTRPFNKLQMRSAIMKNVPKDGTKLFFLDALGVEYLGFISAKCEEYGLIEDVSIGHCVVPSITKINKEFQSQFPPEMQVDVKDLDDLKHHSQIYQYTSEKLPIHLFAELSEIDKVLKTVQTGLLQNAMERAVIVSDHGASRLAVLYGKERDAAFALDEKGEHSGRCCQVDCDPGIPEATYESGYSVLANYERFKGSRKANVEVHGGATLEETVIPVIMLTRKPKEVQYSFTETTVKLSVKKPVVVTLYCTVPMKNPQILVNGKLYDGEFVADKRHAKFTIPEIKRSKTYSAEVLDEGKKTGTTLSFVAKKETREVDMF